GSLLDEASGIRKEETKLVIASMSVNQPKAATSWNKKVASTSTGKSPVSYSLMTARNIQRPQLRFKDKIDNSNLPFKPQLRVKPNAVKSLEESLHLPEGVQPEDVEKPDFTYPNPYQAELDAFSPSPQSLQQVTPQKPSPVSLTPLIMVLHGADSDIGWLQRDFGVYVVNMFDTGQAARVLGLSRFSLAHLLMNYCQVEADKQFQLADWRIRPLPQELINYAREDTHFLLYIYDMMRNQLLDRGNSTGNLLTSVYERSKAVAAKVFQKPVFTSHDYLELYKKSKKVFNNQQLSALKDLYSWRDGMARAEDESLGYVLPNHMLLQIAEILPRERQGVLACCNPIPPLVRQSLMEIHAMVLQAREVALIKVEKRPVVQPSNLQHPKYDVNSLLNCPHDMSHVDERMDHLADAVPEQALVSQTGSMFSNSMSGTSTDGVTLKTTPTIAAYEWKDNQTLPITTAKGKAERVKNSFRSPFAKFMPSGLRGDSQLIRPEASEMWILKASNVPSQAKSATSADVKKRKAESTSVDLDSFEPEYVPPSKRAKGAADSTSALSSSSSSSSSTSKSIFSVPEVSTTAATFTGQARSLFSVPQSAAGSQVENVVEKKIKSLREEANIKKKKKKKALKDKQKRKDEAEKETNCETNLSDKSNNSSSVLPASSSSSSSLSLSTSSPSIATKVTSGVPITGAPQGAIQTNREKKKMGKKNKKLTMEEVEENFSEFDYSAASQAFETSHLLKNDKIVQMPLHDKDDKMIYRWQAHQTSDVNIDIEATPEF
ncbi:exosome component 10, partial [Elysia marginata]